MTKKLITLLFAALILRLVFSFFAFHPDVRNHIDWGIRFWEYGPSKFYSANIWNYTWPNQPPGTIYIFAFIRKLYEFIFAGLWQINISIPAFPSIIVTFADNYLYQALLKLPSMISDIGIGILIYKIVLEIDGKRRVNMALISSAFYLFNPVTWYNSAVWGQTDGLINFFFLFSVYLLIRGRSFLSVLTFALSLYIKSSLLIFAPILFVVMIKKFGIKNVLLNSFISAAIIGLFTLPFAKGNVFIWLFELYQKKVFTQQLHVITANAFNIWALLTGIHERPEGNIFFIFSYKVWGLLLFLTVYLYLFLALMKNKKTENLIWIFSLCAFSSFMFLTNMHERYLFPLFPVFSIIAARERKITVTYWMISLISILNLYNFWWVPEIPAIVEFLSWQNRLMPRFLGLINFLLFIYVLNSHRNLTISPGLSLQKQRKARH